jgi:hypothetical protein
MLDPPVCGGVLPHTAMNGLMQWVWGGLLARIGQARGRQVDMSAAESVAGRFEWLIHHRGEHGMSKEVPTVVSFPQRARRTSPAHRIRVQRSHLRPVSSDQQTPQREVGRQAGWPSNPGPLVSDRVAPVATSTM